MSASQADQIAGVRPILKRVLTNAGMLLGGRTVNAVLSLGYMAVAARALGVRELGVLVLVQAFAQFMGDVVRFQSWQTMIHFGAHALSRGEPGPFQRVLKFTVLVDAASTVLGVALGMAGSFLFAGRLGWTADEAPLAATFMLSIAFMISATPIGLLRVFDRLDVMARHAALIAFLRLVGSVAAWLFAPNLTGFLCAFALGTVGSWLYLAGAAWRELRRRDLLGDIPWRERLGEGLPGVWRFAWNTNLTSTLELAFTHAATLIVGGLVGPAQAAFWRVGRQVADAIAKPARLLTPALYPELARLRFEGRQADMWRLARQVGVLTGALGALLLAVSAFAGPHLLAAVMGAGFAPAAMVMTWQVGAAVIGVLALPLEPMLISLGKPGLAVRVRLTVGALFLALLPWLVGDFGLIGAGAGLVAAAAALALGMLWFILRDNGNRASAGPPVADEHRLEGEV